MKTFIVSELLTCVDLAFRAKGLGFEAVWGFEAVFAARSGLSYSRRILYGHYENRLKTRRTKGRHCDHFIQCDVILEEYVWARPFQIMVFLI